MPIKYCKIIYMIKQCPSSGLSVGTVVISLNNYYFIIQMINEHININKSWTYSFAVDDIYNIKVFDIDE